MTSSSGSTLTRPSNGGALTLPQPSRGAPIALVAHPSAEQVVPNFGVFAVRSVATGKHLFCRLWAIEHYVNHKWWENAALLHLLGCNISRERIRKARSSVWDPLASDG